MFNDRLVPLPLKFANALGLIVVLVVNGLANALPINGLSTGEVSDLYPNLFAPAGITFSIWGIIYLLLILFTAYNFDFVGRKSDKRIVERIGAYFFISCILNAGWIFLWHYLAIGATLVVMILLFLVVFRIFHLAHQVESTDPNNFFFVRLPFSIYAGWITVATIANATAWLVHHQWGAWGLPESTWTVIMMSIATVIMSLAVIRYGSRAYGLVLVWTLAGIGWKHWVFYEMEYPAVLIACAVCAVVMLGVMLATFMISRRKYRKLL